MSLIRLYILIGLGLGTVMEGFAPRYRPGLMERVAERRGLTTTGCLISSAYYPIGTELWVWGKRTSVLQLCTVVDVSDQKDIVRHRRTRRIIELSHSEALTLCGNMGKPTDCPIVVFRIDE